MVKISTSVDHLKPVSPWLAHESIGARQTIVLRSTQRIQSINTRKWRVHQERRHPHLRCFINRNTINISLRATSRNPAPKPVAVAQIRVAAVHHLAAAGGGEVVAILNVKVSRRGTSCDHIVWSQWPILADYLIIQTRENACRLQPSSVELCAS